MLQDAQGLDVTTDVPETVAAIDRFVDEFLGYGTKADVILEGIKADPECALANAYGAALHMFLENEEAPKLARPYLDAALATVENATERERLNVAAIHAWVEGRFDDALYFHEQLADAHPRDICAVKFGQYHFFNRGDLVGLLRLAETAFLANSDNPYMHGMLAFGLEQNHRLDEAEAAGRTATEMQRREPWAHHAVAHVLITEGRTDEGIAWMESLSDTWEDCNSFMYTHNWWHLALFYLDKENFAKVLELYDNRVWGAWKEYSQDQVNAISLLWRLELAGADVGDRWQDVANYVAQRTGEHVEPFLNLHYVYALARAGRDDKVQQMLGAIAAYASEAPAFTAAAWGEVALPAAKAFVAHARGDMAEARALLEPIQGRMQEIGGSNAQRDLFDQTWLDVLMRTDGWTKAIEILQDRAMSRPTVPFNHRLLADAYKGAGLPEKANAAALRVTELSGEA
jgi:hypothetical protein